LKQVFAGSVILFVLIGIVTVQPAWATSGAIYEWGKPVAMGGPGDVPTVAQAAGAVAIDAGNLSDVLVKGDGTVWGWGVTSMTLTQVPGVSDVVQRPVDGNGSFAAIEQPGADSRCSTSTTVVEWVVGKSAHVVTTLNCKNVVQLAEAASHTYALTSAGQVYVWGAGGDVLGLGPNIQSEKGPTLNTALTAITGGTASGVIITTGMTSGGLLVDGEAWSWGGNSLGQCGCASTAPEIATPTAVDQGSAIYAWIDLGGNLTEDGHELAIDSTGAVWAWGDNGDGQLGNGTTVDSDVPVPVTGLPAGIIDVRAGGRHSLALDGAGNVWAWGENTYGQVGNGTTKRAELPVEVLSGMTMISAGALHSLAM